MKIALYYQATATFLRGPTARIPRFHRGGPGSTPGRGIESIHSTFLISQNFWISRITANSENLVSARAKKTKKPGHSKKEMASIKGKRKADESCS